jgi:MFS transporter, PCFT/HCP family, solute carrier family 46 (folate transporter), member 1
MAADPNMPTEASPLLEERRETSRPSSRAPFQARTPRSIVLLLSLNILCLATGGSLLIVPVTRILEDILCHGYYDGLHGQDDSIDERLCKIDAIQSELAYLNGILSMIEATIGMLANGNYV